MKQTTRTATQTTRTATQTTRRRGLVAANYAGGRSGRPRPIDFAANVGDLVRITARRDVYGRLTISRSCGQARASVILWTRQQQALAAFLREYAGLPAIDRHAVNLSGGAWLFVGSHGRISIESPVEAQQQGLGFVQFEGANEYEALRGIGSLIG